MEKVKSFYHEKHKETREEREASPLVHVRKFNNFIKSVLISNALADSENTATRVLDLCGGTGGDLPKFQHHASVKHVVLVDVSPDSVAEAQRRFEQARRKTYDAEFHAGNAFDLSEMLKRHDPLRFDLINCQFAMHYAFSTPDQVDELFNILSHFLKDGGKCVVTVPNANFILDQVQDGHRLKRPPFFEIQFPADERTDHRAGAGRHKYTFSMGDAVKDVPEYLVRREQVEKAATKWGLKINHWTPFQEYFSAAMKDPDHYSLATKMQCLTPVDGGMSVDPGAWMCAQLYVAIEFEK